MPLRVDVPLAVAPGQGQPRRDAAGARGPAPWVVWMAAWGLVASAIWLCTLGLLDLIRARIAVSALSAGELHTVGPALVVTVAVIFAAERRWPAVPRPARSRAHMIDAAYLCMFGLVAPAVTLLGTGFSLEINRYAPFLVLRHISMVPRVILVALILIGIDGMNWAAHVANHRLRALWRFHALHHSQEDMSVLTTFRTHPLAHLSYAPAVLPALILEASGTVPAAALVAYGCLVALPHANLRWGYGPLGRWMVSPAFHRLHHAREPVAGLETANFGFVLAVWDRMAGTAAFPEPGRVVPTGIGGRLVPVEQQDRQRSGCRLIADQLMQPFRLRSGLERRS